MKCSKINSKMHPISIQENSPAQPNRKSNQTLKYSFWTWWTNISPLKTAIPQNSIASRKKMIGLLLGLLLIFSLMMIFKMNLMPHCLFFRQILFAKCKRKKSREEKRFLLKFKSSIGVKRVKNIKRRQKTFVHKSSTPKKKKTKPRTFRRTLEKPLSLLLNQTSHTFNTFSNQSARPFRTLNWTQFSRRWKVAWTK